MDTPMIARRTEDESALVPSGPREDRVHATHGESRTNHENWGNGTRRGLACGVRLTQRRNTRYFLPASYGVATCPDLHDYELQRKPHVEAGLAMDTSIVSVFHLNGTSLSDPGGSEIT